MPEKPPKLAARPAGSKTSSFDAVDLRPGSDFIALDGMAVRFAREGSGPTLVCLHGSGPSLHMFDGSAATLAAVDSFVSQAVA